MSPASKAAGSTYFFQWELQSPTETLNDGAKPLIESAIALPTVFPTSLYAVWL